jgi:integrative and conjugative element protein (TIGR02256 family)
MYTVWLKESAYIKILEETIKWMPFETGGILIGYWGPPNEIVVTDIVGPGPLAMHENDSFEPDHEYQVREISKKYFNTNRTETYLGDWHTHPNSSSYLSEKDKRTLKRIADFKKARLKKPLMLVLGTHPFELLAVIQQYGDTLFDKHNKEIIRCDLVVY